MTATPSGRDGSRERSILSRAAALLGLLSALVLGLAACTGSGHTVRGEDAYRSVWASLFPPSPSPDGGRSPLQQDFASAASSVSQAEAMERWTRFLSDWAPADGQFEDGMQARLVNWAELERERLRYLMRGEDSAAESVSRELHGIATEFE
ncbi:MAG: hypothetical protein KDH15_14240 [Rhodocyclaceae bacterium]|nr:hypothetical protein [Rhodocyclaceae bacterium]